MSADEMWIVLTAVFVGLSSSMVGTFLVLRRLSMLGDAISHSVLFGLVLAMLATGTRSPGAMFVGALAVGLLTAFLTNFLNTRARLQEDASIGVTFTWLFALGIIFISLFAGQIDIDQDCVLFGEIAFIPFTPLEVLGVDIGPRGFYLVALTTIINAIVLIVGFQRFSMLAFDPLLAQTIGIKVNVWHYLLMAVISLTTVASFDAVGAILVVALLVIPPNTAYLMARSVREMMILSCLFSTVAAVGGFFLARQVDSSISASIVIVAGLELFAAVIATALRSAFRTKALGAVSH